MVKIRALLIIATLLSAQAYAAAMPASAAAKPCAAIAHKCTAAGFNREEAPGKNFWLDCMKPILLGHMIKGVTTDAVETKACRADKIADLKKELQELEQAAP